MTIRRAMSPRGGRAAALFLAVLVFGASGAMAQVMGPDSASPFPDTAPTIPDTTRDIPETTRTFPEDSPTLRDTAPSVEETRPVGPDTVPGAADVTPATGGVIREVRIEGTQRVDPETVRANMAVGIGDRADPSALDETLKQLFETGFFEDVELSRDDGVLIVRVTENPVVNRVAFEGNDGLGNDELRLAVRLQPRSIFTRPRVQNDVSRMLELYRRNGYFAATVEPKVIRLPQNRVDVVFEVDEGEKTRVEKIVFIGNKKFSDRTLRGQIRTTERAWWRFLTSDDIYDPDRLEVDQEMLRRFYLNEGYADFRVVSAVAELTRDRRSFVVTYTLEEGERYRFGDVSVESQLDEIQGRALEPLVSISSGDWYNAETIEEVIQTLTDEVGEYGFAFVDVRPRLDRNREEKTIDVVFEVGEGPRVYVNRIDIEGNVRTLDRVIRREFELVEGDAFNSAKLRESERRIRNLGFFESVNLTTEETGDPDRMRVVVDVEEQSTGEFSLGGGFSTTAGLLADIRLQERNFLGKGQEIQIGAQVSQRRQLIDLGFTEPYFLGRNLSAGFDVFNRREDVTDESSFDRESLGFSLRSGFRVGSDMSHRFTYTLRRDDIDPGSEASRFIRAEEGANIISSVGYVVSFDRTDDRFDPTEGFRVSLNNEFAGVGGDVRYLRNELSGGYFLPVLDDFVLSFMARAGTIVGVGQNVGLNDRYQSGAERLRGFALGGVGPRDAETADALGGNYYYTGTVELGFPIPFAEELGIQGRLFGDVGSLRGIDEADDPQILQSGALRASAGIGLSWRSPFGPIRLDFAQPVIKEDFDKVERFLFSFGTRF